MRLFIAVFFITLSSLAHAAIGSVELLPPTLEQLALGDSENRIAVALPADISPQNAGQWSADGLSWSVKVSSVGATALYLNFDSLDLPADAILTLVDSRGGEYIRSGEQLVGIEWLPRSVGSELELRVLFSSTNPSYSLHIDRVHYGYKGQQTQFQKAGSCNVHTACEAGDTWRDEIQSVARYEFRASDGNAYLCSGTLVNNTAVDGRALFLTAEHCVAEQAVARTVTLYWNFEARSCGSVSESDFNNANVVVQSGANLLAVWATSDFSLLELDQKPNDISSRADVHYAGWDRRNLSPSSAVGIHHPSGNLKRISFDDQRLEITRYGGGPNSAGAFLRVESWDAGTTEGGSSGSGLWNPAHRLVGQLSGGTAACGNSDPDWYGRLASAWEGGGASTSRLKDWLDPASLNAECIDGSDIDTLSALDLSSGCTGKSGGRRNPDGAEAASGGGGAPLGLIVLLFPLLALRRYMQS